VGRAWREARTWLGVARRSARRGASGLFAPFGLAIELGRALRVRTEIATFQQRAALAARFPAAATPSRRPVVVAVVTHVASPDRTEEETTERLGRTLDALVESLGMSEIELIVNTMPGRHCVARLPRHLRERVAVAERTVPEPLLLGFEAQGEFVRRAESAEWFLYLEDDILLSDSLALEKLAYFNAGAPAEALLLPHRYEYWKGRRTYIDLVSKLSPEICGWNRFTVLEIGDWKFAEFANPHSGFYALSRPQLHRWLETGRSWYERISWVAARESAATGCLAEAFRLYKPHPDNMNFLEVRHLDTKYSEEHARRHPFAVEEPM
jgi:hypothetical protein